jgi:hypothetical protein
MSFIGRISAPDPASNNSNFLTRHFFSGGKRVPSGRGSGGPALPLARAGEAWRQRGGAGGERESH